MKNYNNDLIFRLNILTIKDYIYLRNNNLPSEVYFNSIKHLNLPNGLTVWQTLKSIDEDYDVRYQPSIKTLDKLEEYFKLNNY